MSKKLQVLGTFETSESVRYTPQTLTPEQKKQACSNIGAQPAGDYALKDEIPSVPVQSVNGKTGAVQLVAADVGALPADTQIPAPYTLPTASETVKGGVKVGKGLAMEGDVLNTVFDIMDVVWENARPASTFIAQFIPLNLHAYKFLCINYHTSISGAAMKSDSFIPIGEGILLGYPKVSGGSNTRNTTTSKEGVTFGSGNDGSSSPNDDAIIPYQIIAVKEV